MQFLSNLSAIALLASQLSSSSAIAVPSSSSSSSCRCLPDDSCWPTTSEWKALNRTVGGRLVATVPLGKPCHDPAFDSAECQNLQSQWLNPQLHMQSSSSVMAPPFANQSCDPWQPQAKPCTLGNYVSYAVNVTRAQDIIEAINFAQKNNIRFVIRNTGHDYLGKSTGAGALSVWTHYLKDIEFLNWSDKYYKGKAITLGAGVQGYEILAASSAKGLVTVGGECATVGVAGGYTQGGGHSALSSSFGLAADNVLSWEVVTADGRLVTASRFRNTDLYWALSGGGGGTYGVVVSVTVKAYPDAKVGGATLTILSSSTTVDTFYEAIDKFHTLLPAMVDAGCMVVYYFTTDFLAISPITCYGKDAGQTQAILAPFVTVLGALNIPVAPAYTTSATYQEHFNAYFGPLPYGNINVGIAQYGSRMISRANVENNMPALSTAYRNITQAGVTFIGVGLNVSSLAITSGVSNSVLPAWRNTLVHSTLTLPWSFTAPWADMVALADQMTYSVIPQLEAATPNSGAYGNEGNPRQPNWKETFFGVNYSKLLAIKKKYDPEDLFYAVTAVGSDVWNVDANGRMCKARK